MSILIKGMEMPTYEQGDLVLRIRWDGRVDKDYSGNTVATAVPVPPHGDLIDRDALMKGEGRYIISFGKEGIDVAEINRAPTIIPAEPAEEGET